MDAPPAEPTRWVSRCGVVVGDCPTDLAWAPDGRRIAVSSLAGDVVAIDTDTGDIDDVTSHLGGALCVEWGEAGLVTGGQDGTATVDGARLELGGWVTAVSTAAGGHLVAFAHGRCVSVLARRDGPVGGETRIGHMEAGLGQVVECDRHASTVTSLRWDPNGAGALYAGSFCRVGRTFVRGGLDAEPPSTASLADVELIHGGAIAKIQASTRSGWWCVGTRGSFAYIWNDVTLPAPVAIPTGKWSGELLDFSSAGDLLVTASRQMIAVFDFASEDPLGMPSGLWLTSVGVPTAVAWRPDFAQLVAAVSIGAGSDANGILVWEPRQSPGPLAFYATQQPVERMAWNATGDDLALAFSDGTVSVGSLDPNPAG